MLQPSVFRYTNPSGVVVWKVDVQTGVKPNGKPIVTRRTAATKREALELGQKLISDALKGRLAPEGREHFQSFALRWLYDSKAPQVRKATVEDYRYKLEHFIFPIFGERQLRQISSDDVSTFLRDLSRSGIANYSINGVRQVLGAVLKGAVNSGLIEKNPVNHVPRYRQSRRNTVLVREPWTRAEAIEALAAIKGSSVELFGTLLIYLGLRKSEVLGLQWRDFDFEHGTVTINRSIREISAHQPDGTRRSQIVEEEPKTQASNRTLTLSPPVLRALFDHRKNLPDRSALLPDSWILATKNGTPPRPSNLQRALTRELEANGVRIIRIHDVRHTAIVMALEAGTPIEAVSQGAGHSRLDTTKSIYAPYCQALADRFANGVSNFLHHDEIDRQIENLLDEEQRTSPGPNNGRG